jgi:hypothetical protein
MGRVLRPLIFALGLAGLLLGRLLAGLPAVPEPEPGSGQAPWVERSELSEDDERHVPGLTGLGQKEGAIALKLMKA